MFFSHFFFNFWSLSQISVPSRQTILRRICKFRGQFEEWTFRRVGTNFSNSRVFLYVSMNHISLQRPHGCSTGGEKWMCYCNRSRTARTSIRIGWYHMISEASGERFKFWARASPLCASRVSKIACEWTARETRNSDFDGPFRALDVCAFCTLITVR